MVITTFAQKEEGNKNKLYIGFVKKLRFVAKSCFFFTLKPDLALIVEMVIHKMSCFFFSNIIIDSIDTQVIKQSKLDF